MTRTTHAVAPVARPLRVLLALALTGLGSSLPLAAQDGGGEPEGPTPLDVLVDDDPQQRYLLHGLVEGAEAPEDGWRLLVVMPGGDGSADFAPFVGRIRENALGDGWLIAQLVAPKWGECGIVWPTKRLPCPGMQFASEELFENVVDDVEKRCELDPRYLFTLSWSSSGPLAYTLALDKKSRVTGSLIAMSVFKPDLLPSLKPAKGRAFYLLHSPEDATCPFRMAEQARDELEEVGAELRFATYAGGHGWHGDVFGNLRAGFDFLGSEARKLKRRKR